MQRVSHKMFFELTDICYIYVSKLSKKILVLDILHSCSVIDTAAHWIKRTIDISVSLDSALL